MADVHVQLLRDILCSLAPNTMHFGITPAADGGNAVELNDRAYGFRL